MTETSPSGYSLTQIILHWITAFAVITAFVTHDAMVLIATDVREAGGAPFPTIHTLAGLIAFVAIVIRLLLRRRHGAPEAQGSELNQTLAKLGHWALYALVIIVPLMGAVSWFGGVESLSMPHGILGKALMLLALGHAAMAIWHQFVKKDGTLLRMLKPK